MALLCPIYSSVLSHCLSNGTHTTDTRWENKSFQALVLEFLIFAFQSCTADGTNRPLNSSSPEMIFVPTLSDFDFILEASIHVITGEISHFLPQPNSKESKMTQQLSLWNSGRCPGKGEAEGTFSLSQLISYGSWGLFLFFLFQFYLFVDVALFKDGSLISVHFFERGRRD